MLYYINVTSWNLLESFGTESLSPHSFYSRRSFGNNLSRYLDSSSELCNYLVLSTRDTKGDYSIQVDSELLDPEYIRPVSSHKTLFTYSKTIYFKKGYVSFRFDSLELMSSLIAEAHILLEVKCIEKYKDDFIVKSNNFSPVNVANKLGHKDEISFEMNDFISFDNSYNTLKGVIIGYTRGQLTSYSSDEQMLRSELISLKNAFTGLNTSIMISGEAVKQPFEIFDSISRAKGQYAKLRSAPTNYFDIITQQFGEIISLASMRSAELEEFKHSDRYRRIHELEKQRNQLSNKIFSIEMENSIADYNAELQAIKDQERIIGQRKGKTREYFKKDTTEYARKKYLEKTINSFKESHAEYAQLINQISAIDQRIHELESGESKYDNVLQGIFARISDIMNDLIKKADDSITLNGIEYANLSINQDGTISVTDSRSNEAEIDYLNVVLEYLIQNPVSEPLSDSRILTIITSSAVSFKTMASASTPEGLIILNSLREFWYYKNNRSTHFSIPDNLPIFQSMMAFYVKPFGFDQMERYMLNKKYSHKEYAFMLWGACLGYASLPKTFTNVIYQEPAFCVTIDNYLTKVEKVISANEIR